MKIYNTITNAAITTIMDKIKEDELDALPCAPGALLASIEPVGMKPALQVSTLVLIWKNGADFTDWVLRVRPVN